LLTRKTYLVLIVSIVAFTALYLYYIKIERQQSIEKYFDNPKVGDIYKLQEYDDSGDKRVYYLKLVKVDEKGLVFSPGKWEASSSNDYLLKHFDDLQPRGYTYEELKDIRNGKWATYQHNNTTLIEIVRK
jgi:hypothetical protein